MRERAYGHGYRDMAGLYRTDMNCQACGPGAPEGRYFGQRPVGHDRSRQMAGLLWQSFEDVRLEKARFNGVVQQFAQEILAQAQGKNGSFTVGQSSLNADWQAYYKSWNGFYTTGTDQSSTLFFPNQPDSAEWSTLMQYEADLTALQGRAATAYPKGSFLAVVPSSPSSWSLFSLFPSLSPSANATATSIVWVGAALAFFAYGGPILSSLSGAAASNIQARRK
jgi:hypothetical protein